MTCIDLYTSSFKSPFLLLHACKKLPGTVLTAVKRVIDV